MASTTAPKITGVRYKSSFSTGSYMDLTAAVSSPIHNGNGRAEAVSSSSVAEGKLDFYEAVKCGDTTTVQKLLSQGFDPDEPDWRDSGRAPLLEAVNRLDVTMVRLLLASGCSVDVCTSLGETALHLAIEVAPLSAELVNVLLDSGADPGIQERLSGNTPLHLLVTKHLSSGDQNRKCVLEVLFRLASHVEVDVRNFSGCTAVHRIIAASTDDGLVHERVRVLLEASEGRGASAQNAFGETPLHSATDRRLPLTVEVLLGSAVELDVNARDRYRMTALHYASTKNCETIVRLLMRQPGCDVDAADLNGDTSLHLASGKGHVEVVRLLLNSEGVAADPNAVNGRGLLPIHKAIESGFVDVVKELLRANCGILAHTGYDATPLDLACTDSVYRARPEISRLLLRAVQDTVDDCTITETPI